MLTGQSELPGKNSFWQGQDETQDPKVGELRKRIEVPKAACPLRDPGQGNVPPFYRGQRGQMVPERSRSEPVSHLTANQPQVVL